MTRSMNSRLSCPTCNCQMSAETHFERWMRENELLDSGIGIVRFDIDVLIHRYRTYKDRAGVRDVQAMMFIEVKTWGARPTPAQADTLYVLNQVLRNRKKNMHKNCDRHNLRDHVPIATAYSLMQRKPVTLRLFGGHLLRFQKNGPDDSEWIEWDKWGRITKDQLIRIIRFELDPDNPAMKLDIRRRSKSYELFDRDGIDV